MLFVGAEPAGHDAVVKRGRAGAVATMVAVVCVAACGSSATHQAKRVDVHAIVVSTNVARTARFETTLAQPKSDGQTDPDSNISHRTGVIDFVADRGDVKLEQTTPSAVGQSLGLGSQEAIWIGSVLYTQNGIEASADRPWQRVDYARVLAAGPCATGSAPSASGVVLGASGIVNPDDFLNEMTQSGATLTNVGPATVRGVQTTRWSVVLAPRTSRCNADSSTVAPPHYDVFTDAQQRLRRIVSTYPNAQFGATVITTDLFDFGVPVHVDAPAADQVTDLTDMMVATANGPGKTNDGWRAVATATAGAPFTVWFAGTTTGWRCFDLEPNPLLAQLNNMKSRKNGPPQHDGHQSQCLYPGATPALGSLGLVSRTTGSNLQFVVAFAPGYSNARLVHADHTTTPVPIDAATGVVNWTGTGADVTRVEAHGPQGTAGCATSPLAALGGVSVPQITQVLPATCVATP